MAVVQQVKYCTGMVLAKAVVLYHCHQVFFMEALFAIFNVVLLNIYTGTGLAQIIVLILYQENCKVHLL